jgi:hypothetical protein
MVLECDKALLLFIQLNHEVVGVNRHNHDNICCVLPLSLIFIYPEVIELILMTRTKIYLVVAYHLAEHDR